MLKYDLHIHTVASGHAHNTLLEYINQAKGLKMKAIGISEHGPSMDGAAINETYFRVLERLPETVHGVRILRGIEANIIDSKGSIDISEKVIGKLDYVMASLHRGTPYKEKGKKMNTKATINAIRSGKIDILTHPFYLKDFDMDVEEIFAEACAHNVMLEINLAYVKGRKIQSDTIENLKKMISIVKKCGKKIIVGSDAHNIWELADDSGLKKIKNKIGLTNDLIINNYPKELFAQLDIK
jgi:putative hydrolase